MIVGSDEVAYYLSTNNQASLEYPLLKCYEDWILMGCESNSLYSHTPVDPEFWSYS
jgi:hypothetical protein